MVQLFDLIAPLLLESIHSFLEHSDPSMNSVMIAHNSLRIFIDLAFAFPNSRSLALDCIRFLIEHQQEPHTVSDDLKEIQDLSRADVDKVCRLPFSIVFLLDVSFH